MMLRKVQQSQYRLGFTRTWRSVPLHIVQESFNVGLHNTHFVISSLLQAHKSGIDDISNQFFKDQTRSSEREGQVRHFITITVRGHNLI